MEREIENRNYELAYHLDSDIEESSVRSEVQIIEELIAKNGGSIIVSKEPKQQRLSYPLNHKRRSYFGIIDFSGTPDIVEKVDSQSKLNKKLMRFLIVKKDISGKELRTLTLERPRSRMRPQEGQSTIKEGAEHAGKPKEEIKPEQIEKEIEDVLEKI